MTKEIQIDIGRLPAVWKARIVANEQHTSSVEFWRIHQAYWMARGNDRRAFYCAEQMEAAKRSVR